MATGAHAHWHLQPAIAVVTSQLIGVLAERYAPGGSPSGSRHCPESGMSVMLVQLVLIDHALPAVAELANVLQ